MDKHQKAAQEMAGIIQDLLWKAGKIEVVASGQDENGYHLYTGDIGPRPANQGPPLGRYRISIQSEFLFNMEESRLDWNPAVR